MRHLTLERLRLSNYRCFDAIELTFHHQLTVLVASNGSGKTSILDAVAIAFGPYVGAFDEATGAHFTADDIRQVRVRKTATHEMEYAPMGIELIAEGYIPGSMISELSDGQDNSSWRRNLSGPTKAKTTIKDARELQNYGKRLQQAARTPGTEVLLPLIAYYGTGRLWQQKKLTDGGRLQRTSRTIGYADSLDPASSYKSFVQWFRYWNFNAKNERIKAQETGTAIDATEFDEYIESVSAAVNRCLEPVGWKDIEYSFSRDALVAHHDELGELPVELLSDGIRNMIGMVADIAFRATKLNGYLGQDAAKQTPGIVLIDEVDMHLHPEWQQVVLQNLTSAFPTLQFIVTTHSPQVLSTVASECIRILGKRTDPDSGYPIMAAQKVASQTLGVASSDLLARVMGVDPVPDVPESRWVSDYQALIQQNLHHEPEAANLREKLEAHFGRDHPVIRECDRMIRLQEFKQRLPRELGKTRE